MIWWAFALGVIVGGVFGLVIMAFRRQFHKNLQNFRAIALDLQTMVTARPRQGRRAGQRPAEGLGPAALRRAAVRRVPRIPVVPIVPGWLNLHSPPSRGGAVILVLRPTGLSRKPR